MRIGCVISSTSVQPPSEIVVFRKMCVFVEFILEKSAISHLKTGKNVL